MTDPLFKNRTPEAAARQMAVVLMYYLECQYATLEGLPKSTSKRERARHQSIADGWLKQVMDLDISPQTRGLRGAGCGRVIEAMQKAQQ